MHPIDRFLTAVLWLLTSMAVSASDPSSAEFFESRIRPVLIQECYECHNSATSCEANLALDFRDGWLRGGDSGPAVRPGRPDESLLLKAIEHRSDDLKMPPSGLQLSREVLDDFRRWIAAGAFDPREHPPSADLVDSSGDWQKILEARRLWWSFQPIQQIALPLPDSELHPIDQFIQIRLAEVGLAPNTRASNEALIRRVYWNLVGLPPSHKELERWSFSLENAESKGGKVQWKLIWEQLVDSLLGNPGFGERWARHWMDWVRYAESHGSEGDPPITNAWMYRDYLIRAINDSIGLDEMTREQIAGDLLPPRYHPDTKLNQSLIATAHWRMVFHGFSPVDAMEERVRFTDDQINAFSKAFLGITLSCARCHDHKFDPISQADYYAMFGVLSSCRPGRQPADSIDSLRQHHAQLRQIKSQLRLALAETWQRSLDQLPQRLGAALESLQGKQAKDLTVAERALQSTWEDCNRAHSSVATPTDSSTVLHWDLTQPDDRAAWYPIGPFLEDNRPLGEIVVSLTGEKAIEAIDDGGVNSRLISDKEAARISSPDFVCPPDSVLWVLCEGDGGAAMRYAVEDYPRNGTIYPVYSLKPGLRWLQSDLSYWAGDSVHVELTTAADAPLLTGDQQRSWFRVQQVWVLPKGTEPTEADSLYRGVVNKSKDTSEEVSRDVWIEQIADATVKAIDHWKNESATADEARLLELMVGNDILANDMNHPLCAQLIHQYRQVEGKMLVATRVPCLEETKGQDSPLLIRGDHRQPAERIARRFLEAIDGRPFETSLSGRLELADKVLDESNPLTRRVFVNRVWQHLFGVGIVSTSDNLGRLGALPTHPELLDWLSNRLLHHDWSLKKLIREILMTDTWQRSSTVTSEAMTLDPDNRLLGRASIRRHEAEAVRDALLSVTGNLDSTLFGPAQSLDGARRSIYLPVVRNSLVPFLRTFDFPEPFTTVGRREQTNVPAQSLALMNDPQVAVWGKRWAEQCIAQEPNSTERIRLMLESALSRRATTEELSIGTQFIEKTFESLEQVRQQTSRLSKRIEELQKAIEQLEAPLRSVLQRSSHHGTAASDTPLAVQSKSGQVNESVLAPPEPIIVWNFARSGTQGGQFHDLKLIGSAKVSEGALVLQEGGYALTPPQSVNLKEKTLSAWVQLDNLTQRAAGIVSVQSLNGELFDSIVFGERTPAHWLAGSNYFARTKDFDGEAETSATRSPVHLAIVYQADGTILGYRNGRLYGRPYRSSGIQEYAEGQWLVSLGLRHLPASIGKTLSGRILSASVYDRALLPEQVAAIALTSESPISQAELLAAMNDLQRTKWYDLNNQLQAYYSEQAVIADSLFSGSRREEGTKPAMPLESGDLELLCWTEFARSVFTLKEFIYVP